MSLNIKTEPSEENVLSDEDLSKLVSYKKNTTPTFQYPNHPETTETRCSICLEDFTNKCYTNKCIHMFCFECLKTWSGRNSTCPLCKKRFQLIYHSLSEIIHETYEVPRQGLPNSYLMDTIQRTNLPRGTFHHDEQSEEDLMVVSESAPGQSLDQDTEPNFDAMRTRVYRENLWAEPLPDLNGQFRDCSPVFFRENPAQVNRLHSFILRDINVIITIERTRVNVNINETYLITLIMRSILRYEIRDTRMTNMLRPFLGPHTTHFFHELYNFANSPLDHLDYDVNVRYSNHQNHSSNYQNAINALHEIGVLLQPPVAVPVPYNLIETVIFGLNHSITGVESRPYPNNIAIQSFSDLDVHFLSPLRSIAVSNSRNQTSTSISNQDSVDGPNNRYNLRRRTNQQLENIVSGSDNSITRAESRQYPNDITIQSSSDVEDITVQPSSDVEDITVQSSSDVNSDVEVLRLPFHPTEVSNSRDQPSTSTGIRNSVDRPNNRYDLRKRTNQ